METTVAILTISGNVNEAKLLLITNAKGLDKKLLLTWQVSSIDCTFLVSRDTRIYFTSLEVTFLLKFKGLLDLKWLFKDISFYFDYTRMIFRLFKDILQSFFYQNRHYDRIFFWFLPTGPFANTFFNKKFCQKLIIKYRHIIILFCLFYFIFKFIIYSRFTFRVVKTNLHRLTKNIQNKIKV